MDDLIFLRPIWLLALIPLSLFMIYLRRKRSTHSSWQQEVDAHLLKHVLISESYSAGANKSKYRNHFFQRWQWLSLFWFMSVLALSGPSWDKTPPVEILQNKPPLAIVVNLSRQMDSNENNINILKKMQFKLGQLIEQLNHRPITLIVYSHQAYRVMPLTEDKKLISQWLNYLNSSLMPMDGNNVLAGLQVAIDNLNDQQQHNGQILIVTNKLDKSYLQSLQTINERGVDIISYSMAINPQLNAVLGNFNSIHFQAYTEDLKDITFLEDILNQNFFDSAAKVESIKQAIEVPRDRGPWFLLIILPFILLVFWRNQTVLVVPFVITLNMSMMYLLYPQSSMASTWDELWFNQNEQAIRLISSNPEKSEQLFTDVFWRGIAQYRQGKYEQALNSFNQVKTADGFYNQANTLIHLKRYNEAIIRYKQAIAIKPEYKHAHLNLKLLQKHLKDKTISDNKTKTIHKINKKNNAHGKYKQSTAITKKTEKSPLNKEEKNNNKNHGETITTSSIQSNNKQALSQNKKKQSAKEFKRNDIAQHKNHENQYQNQSSQNLSKLSEENKKKPSKTSMPEKSSESLNNNKNNLAKQTSDAVNEVAKGTPELKKKGSQRQHGESNTKKYMKGYKGIKEQQDPKEQEQFVKYWLDSIEDNPGELLKASFKRQFKLKSKQSSQKGLNDALYD